MPSDVELIDVLDYRGRPVGVADRRVANTTGLLHLCSQVWIGAVRGFTTPTPVVFFQKRSAQKLVAPGLLDVSASGHVKVGASAEATAMLETREELGIDLMGSQTSYLGRRFDQFQEGAADSRIFADVYLAILALENCVFVPDKNEVDEIVEIGVSEGMAFFSGKSNTLRGWVVWPTVEREPRSLSFSNFIYRPDNYYYKVCHAAFAKMNGELLPYV